MVATSFQYQTTFNCGYQFLKYALIFDTRHFASDCRLLFFRTALTLCRSWLLFFVMIFVDNCSLRIEIQLGVHGYIYFIFAIFWIRVRLLILTNSPIFLWQDREVVVWFRSFELNWMFTFFWLISYFFTRPIPFGVFTGYWKILMRFDLNFLIRVKRVMLNLESIFDLSDTKKLAVVLPIWQRTNANSNWNATDNNKNYGI